MKSAIIWYSYSGNTKKVAEELSSSLAKKGEVTQVELVALDEPNNFFAQCQRAFYHKKAKIQPVKLDLSGYDLICFGSPVWAFGPAPAMNTYLEGCYGVEGKEAVLFTTYGSGTGNERSINYMQAILAKKGAVKFNRFSIQQLKVKDQDFIRHKINELSRLWPNG